jgi:hypothetical protein
VVQPAGTKASRALRDNQDLKVRKVRKGTRRRRSRLRFCLSRLRGQASIFVEGRGERVGGARKAVMAALEPRAHRPPEACLIACRGLGAVVMEVPEVRAGPAATAGSEEMAEPLRSLRPQSYCRVSAKSFGWS